MTQDVKSKDLRSSGLLCPYSVAKMHALFTCSESTIETPEQGMKYVQSEK